MPIYTAQQFAQYLIQKILSSSNSVGQEMKPNGESPKHSHNCEIDDSELFNWELK